MVEEGYFPRLRKIQHRYTKEIQNVVPQVHSYFDGCKLEEAKVFSSDSNLIDPTMYRQLIGP